MKVKVTVELEEGLKCTVHRSISSELVIMSAEATLGTNLEQRFKDECSYAAKNAAHQIYNILAKEGMVIEYVDPITKEKKLHKVEDIADIPKHVLKAKGWVI